MEVPDRQRTLHTCRHPTSLSQGLALWAMAVATRVVDLALTTALWAHIPMTTEGPRAADRDVPQRPALPGAERVCSAKCISVTTEESPDVTDMSPPPRYA